MSDPNRVVPVGRPIATSYAVFLQKPFVIVDHSEFICGWGAAFINITVTYPIYKIIFRQVGRVFVVSLSLSLLIF